MPTRRIIFQQLALDARIGILEHELRATQPLHIDAEFDVDVSQEVRDNDIHTVLDYRQLRNAIVDECTRQHVHLLETLSEQIVSRIFGDFPDVRQVRIRVSKPLAFSDCAAVGIEVQRDRADHLSTQNHGR
ncbi:MAG TPA: dihydroneopterin aldolase [Burkholderiaceae bacterium]|jgi:dihydroneopterin aldolase|nr:dihydroneopterin aldolase [Burkholderiaceae bacterium]